MKRVLLAWELGGGIGYTGWLIAIAKGLQAQGCETVLALRELEPCIHQFAFIDCPVVAAPVAPGFRPPRVRREGFHPCGFADLMMANGFGQTHELHALVRAWRGLIDLVRPDLIVGAYSPVLGVAAYGRVPLAIIGYGYTTPPADQATFPLFRHNRKPYADQDELLARVRRVQGAVGAPEPQQLTDIYKGDGRFILSFDELDPYLGVRNEKLVGPLEPLGEIPPLPFAPRFYAYLLGDQPFVPKVVEALAQSGLPGAIYLRNGKMAPPPGLAENGVEWLTRPPPLSEATASATIMVHHGGANSVHAALAAGRQQILLPRNLDQVIMAERASALGLARKLERIEAASKVGESLRALAVDGEGLQRAGDFARLVRERGQHDALPAIVEACLKLLH